jgi:hypothetical protein
MMTTLVANPVNTIPVVLIFGVFILLIFIAAAFSKIKLIGVFGALLLIVFGIWLYVGGIYIEVGKSIVTIIGS